MLKNHSQIKCICPDVKDFKISPLFFTPLCKKRFHFFFILVFPIIFMLNDRVKLFSGRQIKQIVQRTPGLIRVGVEWFPQFCYMGLDSLPH